MVSHAFSHDTTQHTERLAAYWAEALGGPQLSDRCRYETSVADSQRQRRTRRWTSSDACFDQALQDADLTPRRLRRVLHDYFVGYYDHVSVPRFSGGWPDGLQIPAVWNGLVGGAETGHM